MRRFTKSMPLLVALLLLGFGLSFAAASPLPPPAARFTPGGGGGGMDSPTPPTGGARLPEKTSRGP